MRCSNVCGWVAMATTPLSRARPRFLAVAASCPRGEGSIAKRTVAASAGYAAPPWRAARRGFAASARDAAPRDALVRKPSMARTQVLGSAPHGERLRPKPGEGLQPQRVTRRTVKRVIGG